MIEHTEALHVIDVNSGSSANKADNGNQETTALNVNKEAAKEIARQLRLRDLGGIICIDFIDMRNIETDVSLENIVSFFVLHKIRLFAVNLSTSDPKDVDSAELLNDIFRTGLISS